jgi:hypothetical protein
VIRADSKTGRIVSALARGSARKPEPLFHITAPRWLARILVAAGARQGTEGER